MLSERSQTEKSTYYIIPLIKMFIIGKSIDLEISLVVARGWGRGRWNYEISFWGNENVLELAVSIVQPHEYMKIYWTGYFKIMDFMICELFLKFLKDSGLN